MSESAIHPNNGKPPETHAVLATVDSLIEGLYMDDGVVRNRAREGLVALGGSIIGRLEKLLDDSRSQVRWEATKALGEMKDPRAAPALVRMMKDEEFDVRWLAAVGLLSLGRSGVVPLLQALAQGGDSVWLREGAHHVLTQMPKEELPAPAASVISALTGCDPITEVAVQARKALSALGIEVEAT